MEVSLSVSILFLIAPGRHKSKIDGRHFCWGSRTDTNLWAIAFPFNFQLKVKIVKCICRRSTSMQTFLNNIALGIFQSKKEINVFETSSHYSAIRVN